MKTYKIYLKKTKHGVIEDMIMIKEGFIFLAFLFGALWLLYKKVFRVAFIVFLILGFLFYLQEKNWISISFIIPIKLAMMFYIGFEASDWHGSSLEREKYQFLGYASGKNMKEARLRFLDKINEGNKKNIKIF
jgi:hypothetical protein